VVSPARWSARTTSLVDSGIVFDDQHVDSGDRHKVLVLDLVLPNGTAVDLLDFIKSEKIAPPQIVVIAGVDASLLAKIDRSMVKTVMFKPIVADHFSELIRGLAM